MKRGPHRWSKRYQREPRPSLVHTTLQTSYLEADLDFVLHSLLQDEGLFLKGLQVAC